MCRLSFSGSQNPKVPIIIIIIVEKKRVIVIIR